MTRRIAAAFTFMLFIALLVVGIAALFADERMPLAATPQSAPDTVPPGSERRAQTTDQTRELALWPRG
jgi:hypothetical protein